MHPPSLEAAESATPNHPHPRNRPRARAGPPLGAALAAALAVAAPARALDLNGFMPERGDRTLALSTTAEGYDHFWMGSTKVESPDLGRVHSESVSLWLRVGIRDDLALVVNLPYVATRAEGSAGFAERSLQDLTVLAKAHLTALDRGPHRFFVAGGMRTPASSYVADQPVDVGDGTSDLLLRFVYQFQAGRFHLSQQVGLDLRGGGAPNGCPLYIELGRSAGRFTVSLYHVLYEADGGSDIGEPGASFPGNEEEFQRAGVKLDARVTDRLGLSVAAFATLAGRNTAESSGLSTGFVVGF